MRLLLVPALLALSATSAPIFPGSGRGGGVPATVDVVYDFPSINNSSCSSVSVTAPGAAAGDVVTVNARFYIGEDIAIGGARVTAANTVELTLCNVNTSVTTDPDSGTYRFRLER